MNKLSWEEAAQTEVVDTPERKAHIVSPPENKHIWKPGMTAQDIVNSARVRGLKVVALCGHTWVPVRDPEDYDACESCFEIAGIYLTASGE